MDEILLWPVLRGLPDSGHYTCLVSAAYERETSKMESRKRVHVVNEKPIVVWTPDAGVGGVLGISTVTIVECGDENDSTAQLYAFPHSFQVFARNHNDEGGLVEASALVLWDDANEAFVDPGPRHLQFILSQHVIALPYSWDQTQNVTNYDDIDERIPRHKWGFGFVRFLLQCLLLAVGKVFVWKIVRSLKPALQSLCSHFEG